MNTKIVVIPDPHQPSSLQNVSNYTSPSWSSSLSPGSDDKSPRPRREQECDRAKQKKRAFREANKLAFEKVLHNAAQHTRSGKSPSENAGERTANLLRLRRSNKVAAICASYSAAEAKSRSAGSPTESASRPSDSGTSEHKVTFNLRGGGPRDRLGPIPPKTQVVNYPPNLQVIFPAQAPSNNSQAPSNNSQAPKNNGQAPRKNGQAHCYNAQSPSNNAQSPSNNFPNPSFLPRNTSPPEESCLLGKCSVISPSTTLSTSLGQLTTDSFPGDSMEISSSHSGVSASCCLPLKMKCCKIGKLLKGLFSEERAANRKSFPPPGNTMNHRWSLSAHRSAEDMISEDDED